LMDYPLMERIDRIDAKHHIFADRIRGIEEVPSEQEYSFHFSAKDNLCTKDFQTRAGSKILDGYRPPFDATAVRRMRAAGGLLS